MKQIEVFFDYACPYCLQGHENLLELVTNNQQIEVLWRPCEAHPRPEHYGPHSDLCIQGMFFALDSGADLWEYHKRMYKAALMDRVDIEDADVLSALVNDILDADAFREVLLSGRYLESQKSANKYAFEQSGVWVVPAYRLDGKKLDSVENVGTTKKALAEFMRT